MFYIYAAVLLVTICFSFVLLFGAPYLPTLERQRKTALDLLELKRGQTLLELGSGDGRVLVEAAKRGINSIGVELNPIMYLISLVVTRKYRKHIKIIWGNFWRKDWSEADGIFIFLMDNFLDKFNKRVRNLPKKPIKVASFAYKIPGREIAKEKDGVFLYRYK